MASYYSLRLSWKPPKPASQNGLIISYRIRYTSDSTQELDLWNTVIVTGKSKNLTNLKPGVSYTIALSARTSVGFGPSVTVTVLTLNNFRKFIL